jgi:hypothetical protein
MREKHEASDIERYNIEVCVSGKEEIPICFWTLMVAGVEIIGLRGSFSRLFACS